MINRSGAMVLPVVAMTASSSAMAERPSGERAHEAMGIALEGWPYPAPVEFLPLTLSGETVRMAYMDIRPTGRANGRTVMMMHGKNFDSSYWSDVAAWLTARGIRVVIPDQIGFNKSSKPPLDYTFALLAENSLKLADALRLDQFILLGHSTGGAIAIELASMAGERIEQLVLEDPIGIVPYRDYIPAQSLSTLVAAERAYTAESYRKFISHFFQNYPPALYERFVTWRMMVAESGEFERFAEASARTYQMIYRQPMAEKAASLTMPTLLTAGTRDRSTPLIAYAAAETRAQIPTIHDAAERIAAQNDRISFLSVPNVGHVPHLEAPEVFLAALSKFLSA